MDYANSILSKEYGLEGGYLSGLDFGRMVNEAKPDTIIVTTIDHPPQVIIKAMELGCDVITEKPMTTDAEKCQSILDTVKRTQRDLRVTFNYRYAPYNTKIRELIMDG